MRVRSSVVRTLPWIIAAALVCVGWVIGLNVWGPPEAGYDATSGAFWIAQIVITGPPALIVGRLLRRAGHRGLRAVGWCVIALSIVWVAYIVQFSHFGGFCLDPDDVCVVEWPTRIAALIIGLVYVAASAIVTDPNRRRSFL